MSEHKIPKFLLKQEGMTSRQWKSLKRKQLREIEKAYSEFNFGSSYVAGYDPNVEQIRKCINNLKEEMSIKKWGN